MTSIKRSKNPDVLQVQIKLPKRIYEEIFKKELLVKSGHKNMSMLVNNIIFSKLTAEKLIDKTLNPKLAKLTLSLDPTLEPIIAYLSKKDQTQFKPRISTNWIMPLLQEKVTYGKIPELITKILLEWMIIHGYIYKENLWDIYALIKCDPLGNKSYDEEEKELIERAFYK